jgi:hypothetical protein
VLPDLYKSVQILAAHAVKTGTAEYFERYLMRWFSKTFHTPYHLVQEMPFEDVLQAFYEERYATLDEDQFDQEIREMLETPEERVARLKAEEEEELLMQQQLAEAERHNRKLSQVVQPEAAPKLLPKELKETALPELTQNLKDLIKPDVEMKFVGEEELNRLIESLDALQDPERKP